MPSAPSACKNPKMGSKPADVLIRVPTGVAKGVLLDWYCTPAFLFAHAPFQGVVNHLPSPPLV